MRRAASCWTWICPGLSGLDLQSALARVENPLPIVFLTGKGSISTTVQAMRAGAEDFLTKPTRKKVLFAAIERALARDAQDREHRARRRELRARFDALTPREREVLAHVLSGQLEQADRRRTQRRRAHGQNAPRQSHGQATGAVRGRARPPRARSRFLS